MTRDQVLEVILLWNKLTRSNCPYNTISVESLLKIYYKCDLVTFYEYMKIFSINTTWIENIRAFEQVMEKKYALYIPSIGFKHIYVNTDGLPIACSLIGKDFNGSFYDEYDQIIPLGEVVNWIASL